MRFAICRFPMRALALLAAAASWTATVRAENERALTLVEMAFCASCHGAPGQTVQPLGESALRVALQEPTRPQPPDARHRLESELQPFIADQPRVLGDPLNYNSILLADVADNGTGASLEPPDEALRAQLDLPKDQGLIVTSVAPDGPAAMAGLQPNDVLLSLADKPLSKPEDVSRALKDAGDKAVTLKLIRGGKPMTLQVKPRYRVSWAPVAGERREYFVGVNVRPVDEALRGHLDLPAGRGLVVTGILDGSPAVSAGLKANDILLAVVQPQGGDVPLTDLESLVAQVQGSNGKPIELKIRRAGKSMNVRVTPEHRAVPADPHSGVQAYHRLMRGRLLHHPELPLFHPGMNGPAPAYSWPQVPPQPVPAAGPSPTERRLDAMDQELKELRKSIDDLRKSLKRD